MIQSYRLRRRAFNASLYVVTALALAVVAFPVYWLVTTSIKIGAETATSPPVFIPSTVSLENYALVFQNPDTPRFFVNSIVIALASTALTVFLGALAAYSLAKSYLAFQIRR